jgi:tetratricopeptide (TPR) repeat protein
VKTMPFWRVAATCIALLTVTALAVRFAKKRPYFAVGWFWYLGTLVPVIGLVQQGLWPAFADRFAYIPLIGLFIVTVWGFSDLVDRSRVSQTLGFAAGSLAVLGMGIGAWVQTGYWKNSITLFQRAVDVTKDNHLAHYNLGVALYNSGRFNEGLFHCNEALRLNPDDENAHLSVGSALIHLGRWEDALSHFREVLRINPASATARQNVEVIENRLKENLQEAP